MTDDLRSALARPAGAEDRPDLGPLWAQGRRRRRRGRVLTGAAAAVAVVALAVGAVAVLGGGDEDQGVVTGPDTGTLPAPPPAEEVVAGVTPVVESGPVVAGIPTVDEEVGLAVRYVGPDGPVPTRDRLATWEEWDGERWTATLALIAGDVGPPQEGGAYAGEVVPLEPPPTIPSDALSGPGPDRFPAPPDLAPGYYRVCRELGGSGVEVIGVACAQVWVPPAGSSAPAAAASLRLPTGPVVLGSTIEVVVEGAGAGPVQRTAGWEQSEDAVGWTRTHIATLDPPGGDIGTSVLDDEASRVVDLGALPLDDGELVVAVEVPPELSWSHLRLCVTVGARGDEPTCAEVDLAHAPRDPEVDGADASWSVDPDAVPTPESTAVRVLVQPVSCARGGTFEPLRPTLTIEVDRIVITVDVGSGGSRECDRVDSVPVVVELGEAVGDRDLYDGWCASSATADCIAPEILRWSPP